MKKLFLACALALVFTLPAQQKERSYVVTVPERLVNSYWQVIHGGGEEMKVKDYKEIMQLLEGQILSQSNQFHLQDSLAKKKTDSLKTKK